LFVEYVGTCQEQSIEMKSVYLLSIDSPALRAE